jgi:hypothetical protein
LVLLGEKPFHSTYSIADAQGVSNSTRLNHLGESFGLKMSHLCWIPHELTDSLRHGRVETCRGLSSILEAQDKGEFQRFVTGDENWFVLEFHHSMKWSMSRGNVLQ